MAIQLSAGAVYIGDNGRLMCTSCAGATALYSGHDLSGQAVERLASADVAALLAAGCAPRCECGRVALTEIVATGGWPTAREV